MAGRVIDATLRFVDHFTRPMQQAMGRISSSSKAITRAGKDIKKVGKEISAVGAGMTKSVTVPVVAMGTAAIKAGIDYESAFAGVKKTVDATDQELNQLRQDFRDMSKEVPMTAAGLAEIGENAGQLGIKTKNIKEFTRTIADLSVSTNLTQDAAASSLAKFANVTNMSQEQFSNLGSSIVDLGNHFATTESDIVAMGTRLAGAGSQIGLTQGQIMGFATALSSVGIEAEMGGSAFSTAMKRMKIATATGLTQVQDLTKKTGMSLRELQIMSDNDSKGFKELASSIGMTKTEMNNIIKAGVQLENFSEIAGMTSEEFKKLFDSSPEKALTAFITGLGDTSKAGKSTIEMLQKMGFTEIRLSDSLTRMANSSDLVTEAIQMGEDAFQQNKALNKEASQRYETTASKLTILGNKFKDVGITLFDILLPPMTQLMDKIDKAVTAFSKLDRGTQTQIVKFAAMAAATGPVLSVFGKVTQGIGSTTMAIGKFGDFIPKLTNRAKDAGKILQGIQWPKFPIPRSFTKIGSLFGKLGGKAMSFASTAGKAAARFGSIVWNTAPLSAVRSSFSGLFSVVGNSKAFKLITMPFSKLGGLAGRAVGGVGKLGTAFGGVGKAIFTFLGPAGTTVLVLGAIVAAGILVYKNWDKIKKGAKALGKTVLDVFSKSGVDVDAFKKKATGLVTKVKDIVKQFKSAGKEVSPVFKSILGFLGGAFVTGIKVGFGAVVGFASGFLKSAVDVADGVLTALGGITKFVSGIFTGDWKKAWSGVKDIFKGTFSALVGLAKAPINGLIGLINGAFSRISKIGFTVPDIIPGIGGKKITMPKIPTIPMLYTGTSNWVGGPAMIHDRGAEIVDLPSGTRVYPHDKSLQMARAEGARSGGKATVIINKIADKIIVRNDEDIEKIANAVINKALKKICDTADNMGGIEIGDLA